MSPLASQKTKKNCTSKKPLLIPMGSYQATDKCIELERMALIFALFSSDLKQRFTDTDILFWWTEVQSLQDNKLQ